MSLLDKAQECLALSQELLLKGDNARSLALALKAAQYLQLIRLLRQEPERRDDGRLDKLGALMATGNTVKTDRNKLGTERLVR